MLRVLLVAGLTLSTVATAEARGFRLPFHGWSHVHAVGEPRVSPVGASLAAASLSRAGAKLLPPAPKAISTADGSQSRPAPAVSMAKAPQPAPPLVPAVEAPRRVADAGHWCDDGTIVGTGKGFCVIRSTAD